MASVDVSIDSTNQELEAQTSGYVGRTSIATIDLAGATINSDPAAHKVVFRTPPRRCRV